MTVTEPASAAMALFPPGSQAAPQFYFAPGRANLLGAHLDYNGGCVIPIALSKGIYGAMALRNDGLLRMRSAQFPGDHLESVLRELRPGRRSDWTVYLEAAAWAAHKAWPEFRGIDLAIAADLPIARGLASSACVVVLALTAIADLLGRDLSADEAVRMAHAAETEYAGVRCGILDQAAILHARPDTALLFDCLTHSREHLPLTADSVRVGVMDTGVKRELADTAFNDRVAECTQALTVLQSTHPGLTCLREVSRQQFDGARDRLAPALQRRVQHVVDEVERTAAGAAALRRHDLPAFGAALSGAQDSLRSLYEVSTPELDALTGAARAQPGCFGSRLTGAGFGGCAVALVAPDATNDFERAVPEAYQKATGRSTAVEWFTPAGGPHPIKN